MATSYQMGVQISSLKKQSDLIHKQLLLELRAQVDRIIDHPGTVRKSVLDWPVVDQYIKKVFPGVDVSGIPVYIAPYKVMDRNSFREAAGCYIDEFKIVLVKDVIQTNVGGQDKFSKYMNKLAGATMEVEDVVVHELLHAVSHQVRGMANARFKWYEVLGGGIKYRAAEEEFVYSNCMGFYHDKGMSDDQIVDSVFLPFFIHDVVGDRSDMQDIFAKALVTLPGDDIPAKEYTALMRKIMNSKADIIAPLIVDLARDKAYKMIELYHKYGHKLIHGKTVTSDPSDRVSFIDFDTDI